MADRRKEIAKSKQQTANNKLEQRRETSSLAISSSSSSWFRLHSMQSLSHKSANNDWRVLRSLVGWENESESKSKNWLARLPSPCLIVRPKGATSLALFAHFLNARLSNKLNKFSLFCLEDKLLFWNWLQRMRWRLDMSAGESLARSCHGTSAVRMVASSALFLSVRLDSAWAILAKVELNSAQLSSSFWCELFAGSQKSAQFQQHSFHCLTRRQAR